MNEFYRTLKYIREISKLNEIRNEDGIPLLYKYLTNMTVDKDSILYKYLSKEKISSSQNRFRQIIYPFKHNLSQKNAIDNALKYDISIVEGPPGTGKTQAILNMIVNIIMNGKTVAVVSQNNSAVENIHEKFKKEDLHFFIATLGNRENKTEFISNQPDPPCDMSTWEMSDYEEARLRGFLATGSMKVDNMLYAQRHICEQIKIRNHYKKEREYFEQYLVENNKEFNIDFLKNLNSEKCSIILTKMELNMYRNPIIRILCNFLLYIKYGICNFKFLFSNSINKRDIITKDFYDKKIKELNDKITRLQDMCNIDNIDNIMKEYSKDSMILFKNYLAKRYINHAGHINANDSYEVSPTMFTKRYPVVLSTTFSLKNCLDRKFKYDYVIIDEASQVDIPTAVLAFSCAKNAVIIGDEMQLKNIVPSEHQKIDNKIFDTYRIDNAYKYSDNSILTSIKQLFPNVPKTLLKEHYRCHEKIISFCSQKYYNDELIPLRCETTDESPLKAYTTVPGNHARENENQREIDVIKNEILPYIDLTSGSIGIVTPYRNQANALKKTFDKYNIMADTVDKFQGRECDNIIISTVDNNISEFTDIPNRINVAVSRARNTLTVVTTGNRNQKDGNLNDLIKYITYNHYPIIPSKTYSIYDLLYKMNYEKLLEFKNKIKSISEYDSENITYYAIKKIINEYHNLDVACHVPLHRLIRTVEKNKTVELTNIEIKYIKHPKTHVDFIIFNKYDKLPVLAIEVDGVKYHKKGTKQYKRDLLKNEILRKHDINLLRMPTNHSDEIENIKIFLPKNK